MYSLNSSNNQPVLSLSLFYLRLRLDKKKKERRKERKKRKKETNNGDKKNKKDVWLLVAEKRS